MKNTEAKTTTKYTQTNVYAHSIFGDCSNGGISSKYSSVYLFAEECSEEEIRNTIKARKLDPERVMQVQRRYLSFGMCIEAVPFTRNPNKVYSFGGCYLADGTGVPADYREIVGDFRPIAMHDRAE